MHARTRSLARALTSLLVVLSGSAHVSAQTYGYERAEDPLIIGVKQVIAACRKGEHDRVREHVAALSWQIDELRSDVKVDLRKPIDEAVSSKDVQQLGYALTHLVYQAMRQKFHWNEQEKLESYGRARARLDAAEFCYTEILSHAVRRADKAQKKQRHEAILKEFEALRKSLGTPGLFGAGRQEPDLSAFKSGTEVIVERLREVYPDFLPKKRVEEAPPEKAAPPKKDSSPKSAAEQ